MAFHDVSLPEGVDYGSAFGAGFQTIIQETSSGHEYRTARQTQARHRFRLLKELQSMQQAHALKDFGLARRGALHSFKLKDESDNTTATDGISAPTATDQNLGTGDGIETDFRLLKNYGVGTPAPYSRPLALPLSASILAAVGLTPTTAFTYLGNGWIRFDTPPGAGVRVDGGCRFEVPARFEKSLDTWAALIPRDFDTWSVQALDCIEVLEETAWPETVWPGGSRDLGQRSAALAVDFNDGMLQAIEPTVAAVPVFLPDVSRFTPGGPALMSVLVKVGSAGTVQFHDWTGAAIGSPYAAGKMVRFALLNDGSSTQWHAYAI
jgi:uncharacterized protein (TIGR02217 family)